jgi:hypothetical protein
MFGSRYGDDELIKSTIIESFTPREKNLIKVCKFFDSWTAMTTITQIMMIIKTGAASLTRGERSSSTFTVTIAVYGWCGTSEAKHWNTH